MDFASILYSLLVTGAGTLASGAVGELGKSAGKAAFEALKERLIDSHGAGAVLLIEHAKTNPAYEAAIKSDLANPDIAKDLEVRILAEQLRDFIKTLPAEITSPYAVDISVINSGGSLTFDNVEGVRADKATSKADMSFKNVKAPPGK